jgi:hypothetical protein
MESPKLRLQPGIKAVLDAAAVFGVRAIPAAVTRVAGVRWSAVRHDPEAMVSLMALQIFTGGALPTIVDSMVFEARDLYSAGEAMRMQCHALQNRGHNHEKYRVGRTQQHVHVKPVNHDCFTPASTTSVKRISAGCSRATWRAM